MDLESVILLKFIHFYKKFFAKNIKKSNFNEMNDLAI